MDYLSLTQELRELKKWMRLQSEEFLTAFVNLLYRKDSARLVSRIPDETHRKMARLALKVKEECDAEKEVRRRNRNREG